MQAKFFEGKRSLRLLTHHQPGGWSPALEKGGYMIERRADALVLWCLLNTEAGTLYDCTPG
ncbi:hypothetical protein [Acidaminococcus sp. HCP3S3_H5]|uniref:hypothetical protein n=1 Tax=Acidaminococcus sp. HCP3S3_H5 TaxID=3438733 RepID=UPI003F907281